MENMKSTWFKNKKEKIKVRQIENTQQIYSIDRQKLFLLMINYTNLCLNYVHLYVYMYISIRIYID